MKKGVGPWLPNPIRTAKDVAQVTIPNIQERFGLCDRSCQTYQTNAQQSCTSHRFCWISFGRYSAMPSKGLVHATILLPKSFASRNLN